MLILERTITKSDPRDRWIAYHRGVSRAAKFSDDDVLDAAQAALVGVGRDAGISVIAAELGGPVGSIYHRFGSREEVLARLWLRSVDRFHARLFATAAKPAAGPHEVLVSLAAQVPAYCRRHRDEAVALTLFRAAALATSGPESVRHAAAHVNDGLLAMVGDLARQRFGRADRETLDLVATAIQVCPYGLVRPYLGRPVPKRIDRATVAAADAILRLGDG